MISYRSANLQFSYQGARERKHELDLMFSKSKWDHEKDLRKHNYPIFHGFLALYKEAKEAITH